MRSARSSWPCTATRRSRSARWPTCTKPEIKKIAIANPDFAPYGAAGKQALKKAGTLEEIQPKIVLADSVRQAFLFAETGNADVGARRPRAHARGRRPGRRGRSGVYTIRSCRASAFVLPEMADHPAEAFARFVTRAGGAIDPRIARVQACPRPVRRDGPTAADLAPLWLSRRVASLATLLDVVAGVPLALAARAGTVPG